MPRAANRSTFETIQTWSYAFNIPYTPPASVVLAGATRIKRFHPSDQAVAHSHDVTACMPLGAPPGNASSSSLD